MLARLYASGLMNGGLKDCETGGIAVLSVIVSRPVGEGLLNSMFPETEKVLESGSHTVALAVMAIIEQKTTMLQLVMPVPPVCEKVIVPGCVLKFVSRSMYISPTWAFRM
jgi:hypothetical protein